MKLAAVIPIKRNSERLAHKNFLTLGARPLYRWVLETLESVEQLSEILIDTDCPDLLTDLPADPRIRVRNRPMEVREDTYTMNTLLTSILPEVEEEHILQTHVTNPLLKRETIVECIQQYFDGLATYDSLLTVDRIQKRMYDHEGQSINHNNEILLQTQDLKPVFVENSNLFLFSQSSFYQNNKSRIGKSPQLFEMSFPESLDIDTKEDFKVVEILIRQ